MRLKSRIAAVLGISFLMLSYQNCSKTKFNVDEVVKQKTLDEGNVFDPADQVSGVDPVSPTKEVAGADPTSPVATPVATPVASPTPKKEVGGTDPKLPSFPGFDPKNLPGFDPKNVVTTTPGTDEMVCKGTGDDQVCVSDPLLIQLNTKSPQKIALSAAEDGVMFDLLGRRANHQKVRASWFENVAENYFLVLPDAKGEVNGIDELFGDNTFGPDKRFAKQGFAALAKYDESGDNIISSDDIVFSKLRLWKDANLDGVVQASELSTLDEKGVVAIDLRYDRRYKEMDKHGNIVKYKSVVIMKDNSYGLVYDLFLSYINK